MRERFDKMKIFVKEHTEEIVVAVLATLAVTTAYGLVRSSKNGIDQIEEVSQD